MLRAQPASARGRRTLDRILAATTELAAEVSFEAINTNLIAARAGVNIASLYKYFPNKQAIFLTISDRMVAAFHAEVKGLVAQIDAGRPWREAVAEGIWLAARRRLDSPGERAIRMALRLSPEHHGLDSAESRANAEVLAGLLLRRGAAPEDRARIVARVAIEMASSVLDLLMTDPGPDPDAIVAEAADAILRYLEPWLEPRA
ncbi:MAG: TetR/AcrR family transcriptional regulator [Phenylobacterium sp.]